MLALAQLALVAGGLWRPVQPGVWQREIRMAPNGPLSVVQAIAIRIDPAVASFRLDTATRHFGMRGAWSIDRMPADAIVALNTGQFATGRPWGWLVRDGVEAQPPGSGSVAMAFVVDSAGTPALVQPDDIPAWRGRVSLAFQSYPALLIGDGEVPWEIRESGRGVDLEHRDSRLAIGVPGWSGSTSTRNTKAAHASGRRRRTCPSSVAMIRPSVSAPLPGDACTM